MEYVKQIFDFSDCYESKEERLERENKESLGENKDNLEDEKEKVTVVSKENENKLEVEANFLYNETKLRHLLLGVPDENEPFQIICTIAQLLFFGTIIKWINIEVWRLIGDCTYKKNIFIKNLVFTAFCIRHPEEIGRLRIVLS